MCQGDKAFRRTREHYQQPFCDNANSPCCRRTGRFRPELYLPDDIGQGYLLRSMAQRGATNGSGNLWQKGCTASTLQQPFKTDIMGETKRISRNHTIFNCKFESDCEFPCLQSRLKTTLRDLRYRIRSPHPNRNPGRARHVLKNEVFYRRQRSPNMPDFTIDV